MESPKVIKNRERRRQAQQEATTPKPNNTIPTFPQGKMTVDGIVEDEHLNQSYITLGLVSVLIGLYVASFIAGFIVCKFCN